MHYKNGREAKQGDKVFHTSGGHVTAGIIHSLNAQSTTCNGRIAATTPNDPWVTVGDCLHADDVFPQPDPAK